MRNCAVVGCCSNIKFMLKFTAIPRHVRQQRSKVSFNKRVLQVKCEGLLKGKSNNISFPPPILM